MSNSNLKIRDETLYKEYKDGGLKNMLIFQKKLRVSNAHG